MHTIVGTSHWQALTQLTPFTEIKNMAMRIVQLTRIALVICVLHCAVSLAATMGTAFTYQGRFDASGTPASGTYDFTFTLFDAATAGNQVGSTLTKGDLTVSNGYFTTTLDFGAGIFTGDARWLQIAVRPGAETGSYTTLAPRHELTPTPYAINSDNDGTANYIPKFTNTDLTNSIMYESSGKMGIGTTNPGARLSVSMNTGTLPAPSPGTVLHIGSMDDSSGTVLIDAYGIPGGAGSIHLRKSRGTATSPSAIQSGDQLGVLQWIGYGASSYISSSAAKIVGVAAENWSNSTGAAFLSFHTRSPGSTGGASERMRITADGNVGVGTTSPIAKLHVNGAAAGVAPNILTNGDVVIGTSGAIFFNNVHYYATGDFIVPTAGYGTLGFFTSGGERIRINSSGNVGVGTTAPTQRLDVNGTIRCVDLVETSDEQLKTSVQPLDGVLTKLDQIRAVSFQWNDKARSLGAETDKRQIGVLAQELERVFPELVTTPQPTTADQLMKGYSEKMLTDEVKQQIQRDAEATNYKAVNYSQLTVVLLEAVKELKAENESLRQRIETLENKAQ